MSKTSDESLIEERIRAYWRRCAASATAFAHNLRHDLFFRTEVLIIVLQVAFAAALLALLAIALFYLYHDIAQAIAEGILAILVSSTSTPASADSIVKTIEAAKTRDFAAVALAGIAITALFGYLVARLTLSPARNALSAQKQFIGNIAHELRTPLSIIKTNTEVRLLDGDIPESAKKIYRSNLEELDRISDIINNLLSMNALIRPEQIEFKNIDLGEVVSRSLRSLAPLVKRKEISLSTDLSGERLVWGNAAALEQVVTNVVKNALSYTPRGGAVAVSVVPTHRGETDLLVKDTGIGIKKKDLGRIFEPFFRGDYSRNRAQGGSGLGLAIVSELVKLHHGRISIKSAPGKGTTVAIALPAGRSDQQIGSAPAPEIAIDFSRKER